MRQDWLGNPVTAGSDATVAAIDGFVSGFLAYEAGIGRILQAADADPDSALANAYAGMLWLFMESPQGPVKARPYLDRAETALTGATERERMVTQAVRAWAEDDIARAVAIGEATVARFPRELALAKTTQYHHFNRGDAPGMLRVAQAILPANRDIAYAHGLSAFALEQCHMLGEAEQAARTAIAMRRKEPWAQHALAHVMLTQARNTEARAFLEDVSDTWTGLNSFMVTHNWWHLSLVMIEQGEAARVLLEHFAGHVWGVWKEYSQDQIGAVSLLARLELAGVDVGDRWQDVAGFLACRIHDHVNPFLTLQYLYGLARAGRPEAQALLDSTRRYAAASGEGGAIWREVALPAMEGLLAHANGRHDEAVTRLLPVLPRLPEVGGSHAQRDLFDQIVDDALIRSGRLAAAQNRLEQRRAAYPHSAPTLARLASVYRGLGLPHEAERLHLRA